VTTFPWHWVGILGMPRRMAYFDYADPAIALQALSVTLSAIGGFISPLTKSGLADSLWPRRCGDDHGARSAG
jgi:heme/copper-type cytochrome/quinol oxidase subunit 1